MNLEITKDELKNFLLNANDHDFQEMIEFIHPVDLLNIIHEYDDEAIKILNRLSDEDIAHLLDEEDDEDIYELLTQFSANRQKEILEEMSSDEIADFVQTLDEEESKDVLSKMSKEDVEEVQELMSYPPDTAGGIMATEFISIHDNKTVQKTLEYLQQVGQNAEMAYYLYVTDEQEVLKGVVSLRDLVSSPFNTLISEITNPNVHSVHVDDDQEEVARMLDKYDYVMIPVIDHNDSIKGVITIDDIIDIIKEEATEDIHRMAGLDAEEKVDGTLIESIRSRLPWLSINLITALLAASVVAMFSSTIEAVVALAAINPIIAGMGGNAGTQSLTIVVRGIALGELTGENAKRVFLKELGVGLTIGLTLGTVVAIGCYIFFGNPYLGFVAGAAMVCNLIIATVAGYAVPLFLKKCNVDPALASSVFVTTATDVLGFFVFLGLATLLLPYLI
ncbi:magnesium transporter [Anaerorhabdus sp.]|uniref:magnesium transporter n=1 Tax=Anaerorhabdus sp. TaxID=1872524 RepID=UPI002FCA6986